MRMLKTIVVMLGGLLVGGFAILIFGLTQNWHRLAQPAPAAAPSAGPAKTAAPAEGWGHIALGQPPDSHVQSITPAGTFVVVQVVAGSAERLLILDPATGKLVGTFSITEQPTP